MCKDLFIEMSQTAFMFSGTDVVKQCLCLLKNNGVRRARLGGGEPTRHPGFMEIVRYSVARQNMDDDQFV